MINTPRGFPTRIRKPLKPQFGRGEQQVSERNECKSGIDDSGWQRIFDKHKNNKPAPRPGRKATVTIDDLTEDLFSGDENNRDYAFLLVNLSRRMKIKGENPKYDRVIFVKGEEKYYLEINTENVSLEGVFTNISHVSYEKNNPHNVSFSLNSIHRNTLVVANDDRTARYWDDSLHAVGYKVRGLEPYSSVERVEE